MRKNLILLIALVALYFLTSAVLFGIYGPSVGFMEGEDRWEPDGNGGWVAHGHPDDPQPTVPSVNVPLLAYYLPVFVPAFVLALFLFTPLGRKLEEKKEEKAEKQGDGEEVQKDEGDKPPDNSEG
jgi:hypothetical protein